MIEAAATTPASTKGRLPGLDALRGVAAFCVVLMHTHVLLPEFPDLMPRGYLAVDFFFALSGYVMARTYEPRLGARFTSIDFLAARFRRLWPTMLVGAILFLPFLPEGAKYEDVHLLLPLVLNLFLLPCPTTKNFFPLNIPAWSIFFELVANAFHGVFLHRLKLAGLLVTCLLSLAGLVFWARALGDLDIGSQHDELSAGICRVMFTYTLGVILWRTWGERRLPPVMGLLALLTTPLLLSMPDSLTEDLWKVDLAFVVLATPVLLLAGLALAHGRRLAMLAGELSFPLYAVHFPVLYWSRSFGLPPLAAIAACLLGAWLVLKMLEMTGKADRPA